MMESREVLVRKSSASGVRFAASFLALILAWLFVGTASYPLAEQSHAGLEGALVTSVAGAVGVWAYLSCPTCPRILRYFTLILAVLTLWLAADTTLRYVFFRD
jgi:hypothetical protein